MALSEYYESTIIEVKASFGLSDFKCDPSEITQAFRIIPDQITRKGEAHVVRSGKTAYWPNNTWYIESKSDDKDVNVQIRELLKRLSGIPRPLPTHFGEPSFGVVWKGNYLYAGSGPFYEADVIQGIASLDAELYQDIYQIDQEENEPVGPLGLMRI
jgi:hypothetical protein